MWPGQYITAAADTVNSCWHKCNCSTSYWIWILVYNDYCNNSRNDDPNVAIVWKSDFEVESSAPNIKLTYLSNLATLLTRFRSKSVTLCATENKKKVLSENKKGASREGWGEKPRRVERITCPGGATQSGGFASQMLIANTLKLLVKRRVHFQCLHV